MTIKSKIRTIPHFPKQGIMFRDITTLLQDADGFRATIDQIVDKVTLTVRFLALFCLAMGIPVLFSAVAATRRDRLREGVLLKTLGATRGQIGRILLDAVYSPVTRVRYSTEDTRVGQKTNYDKLIIEIWTNGTVSPEMALVEAAKILRKHVNPFVQYAELGDETVASRFSDAAEEEILDEELVQKLNMPIQELELSVRASNCLDSAKIELVGQLAAMEEGDLLKIRSFGKTSLREVKRKLADIGLSLGMQDVEKYLKKEAPAAEAQG